MSFYQKYLDQLKIDFPQAWATQSLADLLNPNLISAQHFGLQKSSIEKITDFVTAIYKLRNDPSYQDFILKSHSLFEASTFVRPENYSALMSFDFHLVDDEQPKLIEINTNASSSLIINESYKAHGLQNIFEGPRQNFESDILACFENEFELWQRHFAGPKRRLRNIAIVDHQPPTQKLYLEFLLYQELFGRAGYKCIIADPEKLELKNQRLVFEDHFEIDLVYNRHTDFYFSSPECAHLKAAYSQSLACFSPHPFEYALLADKSRLFEFSTETEILKCLLPEERDLLQTVLLKSYDVKTFADKNWLWANRKTLFFKPKRMFGGKASYRGQGITQGVFTNILTGDYLAQEFAPPSEVNVQLEDKTQATFKYDLRFYVYQGRIQLALARLWRGQMTNINSVGGGLAPIFINS